jgi:hypothetical protein
LHGLVQLTPLTSKHGQLSEERRCECVQVTLFAPAKSLCDQPRVLSIARSISLTQRYEWVRCSRYGAEQQQEWETVDQAHAQQRLRRYAELTRYAFPHGHGPDKRDQHAQRCSAPVAIPRQRLIPLSYVLPEDRWHAMGRHGNRREYPAVPAEQSAYCPL